MNSLTSLCRPTSVGVAALAGLALATGCCTKSHKTASYHQTSSAYAEAAPQEQAAPAPTGRTEASGNMVVPLYEEKINVGKREVETGSVRLKKVVKTETVNQPIELRHEELIIERQSGSSVAEGSKLLDQPFKEGETVVTVKSEVPVIEKQTTTSGQVVLQTRSSSIHTNIQGEVRREDIAIDKQGASVQGGESTGAAESPGGKASASSAVITDPTMLSASGDASKCAGKQVQFSGLKVRRVSENKVVILDGGNGQSLYVFNKDQSATCNAGDIVNITGSVKTSAEASSAGDAAQQLSSRPFYIEADKIEVSNK